jgi:uncharacterized membrane protein YeaQ/YmgE (transglycosylase-associated protein family)
LWQLAVRHHHLPCSDSRHRIKRPRGKATTPMQARIWLGVLVGSTVGGFIPNLWGAGLLSYSSVVLSAVGGFVGLWLVYKMY